MATHGTHNKWLKAEFPTCIDNRFQDPGYARNASAPGSNRYS
jgi:hypothetical protein